MHNIQMFRMPKKIRKTQKQENIIHNQEKYKKFFCQKLKR